MVLHGHCTLCKSEIRWGWCFKNIFRYHTSYSLLKYGMMLFLCTVMYLSLSALICVCITPNRCIISCSSPPSFYNQVNTAHPPPPTIPYLLPALPPVCHLVPALQNHLHQDRLSWGQVHQVGETHEKSNLTLINKPNTSSVRHQWTHGHWIWL